MVMYTAAGDMMAKKEDGGFIIHSEHGEDRVISQEEGERILFETCNQLKTALEFAAPVTMNPLKTALQWLFVDAGSLPEEEQERVADALSKDPIFFECLQSFVASYIREQTNHNKE